MYPQERCGRCGGNTEIIKTYDYDLFKLVVYQCCDCGYTQKEKKFTSMDDGLSGVRN
jgi:uncharacterized Zn finger protein